MKKLIISVMITIIGISIIGCSTEDLEQVRASHILISKQNEVGEDIHGAKETAENILDMVNRGYDFEELAREYSDDVSTGAYGGNLGYFKRGVMTPEFEDVAFELDEGEVSDVVESEYGYHIIKVTGRK